MVDFSGQDSILGTTDAKEFVVYDSAQIYPEYIMCPTGEGRG